MKKILFVSIGSFFGGGIRYIISKLIISPMSTFFVNIIGSYVLELVLNYSENNLITEESKLLFGTGFCGGLTTFSTFISEIVIQGKKNYYISILISICSYAIGIIAFVSGYYYNR